MGNDEIQVEPDIDKAHEFIDTFIEIYLKGNKSEDSKEDSNQERTDELIDFRSGDQGSSEQESEQRENQERVSEFAFRTYPEIEEMRMYRDEGLTLSGTFSEVKDTLIERNKKKKEGIFILLNKTNIEGKHQGHRIYEDDVAYIRALISDVPLLSLSSENENIASYFEEDFRPHFLVKRADLRMNPIWVCKSLPANFGKIIQKSTGLKFKTFTVPTIADFIRLPGFYSIGLNRDNEYKVNFEAQFEVIHKEQPYTGSDLLKALPINWGSTLSAADVFPERKAIQGYPERKEPPNKGDNTWTEEKWNYFFSYLDKVEEFSVSEGQMNNRKDVCNKWDIKANVFSVKKSKWKERECPDPWEQKGVNPFEQ